MSARWSPLWGCLMLTECVRIPGVLGRLPAAPAHSPGGWRKAWDSSASGLPAQAPGRCQSQRTAVEAGAHRGLRQVAVGWRRPALDLACLGPPFTPPALGVTAGTLLRRVWPAFSPLLSSRAGLIFQPSQLETREAPGLRAVSCCEDGVKWLLPLPVANFWARPSARSRTRVGVSRTQALLP